MVSVCAGLVTVDEESNIIRLVHYTTQEYFERTRTDWFPNVQKDVTITCVTYLSFDIFAIGFCPTDEKFEARLQSNPFYDYAARNWGYHAYVASEKVEQQVLNFLKSRAKTSSSCQAMIATKHPVWQDHDYSQRPPRQIAGIHLTAYFGLEEVMTALLRSGEDPDYKDTHDRTPLSWAAENGHLATVKLLLVENGVDPDSKDTDGGTPLSFAAEGGHEAVVKLLLATGGINPDYKDSKYGLNRTPLSWAAQRGHEAVVKLLLAQDGVNPDYKDSQSGWAQTPLSWAAREGHKAVVELLLAKDRVDPDSKGTELYLTPLSLAAEYGHKAVVELLLAKDGVDPDSKDIKGRTPLSRAAKKGYETIVKLLLATNRVDPNSKESKRGRTPLVLAAKKVTRQL
jgi:ankyrin repeat protein